MPTYIALLRAVNVGGTGKLPMSELKAMCIEAGFTAVQTYIASGNVVFRSKSAEAKVKAELERRLRDYAGKTVGVLVRSGSEMEAILQANPFADKEPNRTCAIFLDEPPTADALQNMAGQQDEQVQLRRREFYVYYPSGQGNSKLRIPAAKNGTARNMNTVAKLADIASKL
jgi:uncharacterized protein (DUF1697 family)